MTENPDHSAGATAHPLPSRPAATLGVRAVARLIDFVLLAIVNAVVVGVVVVGSLLGQSGGMFLTGASSIAAGAISAVLGAAINLGYFGLLESRGGQTIGKMVMKLRVVDAAGRTPSLEQALRRNIWVACGVVGVVPIIGGLVGSLAQLVAVITIAIGISDDKRGGRGWHDRFAGETLVVADAGSR